MRNVMSKVNETLHFCIRVVPWDSIYCGAFYFYRLTIVFSIDFPHVISKVSLPVLCLAFVFSRRFICGFGGIKEVFVSGCCLRSESTLIESLPIMASFRVEAHVLNPCHCPRRLGCPIGCVITVLVLTAPCCAGKVPTENTASKN